MKNLATKILIAVSILVGSFLAVSVASAALLSPGTGTGGLLTPSLLVRSGITLIPSTSGDTLGGSSSRWAGVYGTIGDFTNLNISSLTGNIDIGGFQINDAGKITGTSIVATSTSATSTFAAAITVGAGQGTSTFAGGVTAAGILGAQNFNATSLTATSTLTNVEAAGNFVVSSSGSASGLWTFPQTIALFDSSLNNYGQVIVQNRSIGANNGSSVLVFNNSSSTQTTYFGELGFNSQENNEAAFTAFSKGAVFLNASDGEVDISTGSTTAASVPIKFMTAGTLSTNERMRVDTNGNIGIGTTSPGSLLSIATPPGSNGSMATLLVVASSTPTATTTLFGVRSTGVIVMGGKQVSVATSTGSGTGSVPVTITGTAQDFNFNIVTGSSPAGSNATIATFTLPSTCPTATVPVWSDANKNADALAVVSVVFASSTSASAFVLVSGATGLTGATNYIWNFHVGCY